MKASKFLVIIVVLQGLILLGQWTGVGLLAPAQAQIPDAGAQRSQIIEELRTLNGKMDKLIEAVESVKVQAKAAPSDQKE